MACNREFDSGVYRDNRPIPESQFEIDGVRGKGGGRHRQLFRIPSLTSNPNSTVNSISPPSSNPRSRASLSHSPPSLLVRCLVRCHLFFRHRGKVPLPQFPISLPLSIFLSLPVGTVLKLAKLRNRFLNNSRNAFRCRMLEFKSGLLPTCLMLLASL